jgi:serine/threonine-protein kinase RsbW
MASRLTISAELKNLQAIRQFIDETGVSLQASREALDALIQAVDESATNIIIHGYQGTPGRIEIQMDLEGDVLVVRLKDQAPNFDPTQIPPCDLTVRLEERRSGGLGMHMIRCFTDEVTYRVTPEGSNELTLRKTMR